MRKSLRAKFVKGRLVLNEPTGLPDGAEVEFQTSHTNPWMTADDRALLGEELDASEADLVAGRVHSLDEIVADFKARRA